MRQQKEQKWHEFAVYANVSQLNAVPLRVEPQLRTSVVTSHRPRCRNDRLTKGSPRGNQSGWIQDLASAASDAVGILELEK